MSESHNPNFSILEKPLISYITDGGHVVKIPMLGQYDVNKLEDETWEQTLKMVLRDGSVKGVKIA